MKKTGLILLVLLSVFGNAYAEDDGANPARAEAAAQRAIQSVGQIRAPARKQALKDFVQACLAREWVDCAMARYDLEDVGLVYGLDGEGDVVVEFKKDDAANTAYAAVFSAVSAFGRADYEAFTGMVYDVGGQRGYPMFQSMKSDEMQIMAMALAKKNFLNKKIPYPIEEGFDSERLETLRRATIAAAMQGNKKQTEKGLSHLYSSVKLRPEQQVFYNNLRIAVLEYLRR